MVISVVDELDAALWKGRKQLILGIVEIECFCSVLRKLIQWLMQSLPETRTACREPWGPALEAYIWMECCQMWPLHVNFGIFRKGDMGLNQFGIINSEVHSGYENHIVVWCLLFFSQKLRWEVACTYTVHGNHRQLNLLLSKIDLWCL